MACIRALAFRLASVLTTAGVLAGGCLMLSACSGVLESGKPARQVYLLHPPRQMAAAAPAASVQHLVINVTAVPGLDTDLILALGPDARMNPVANAHWPDNLPEVFTSLSRRTLSESGLFQGVSSGTLARPSEWMLELELQAFYGVQGAGGQIDQVRLAMEGQLQCHGQRHVLDIAAQAASNGTSLASLVRSHQQVIDSGLGDLPQRISSLCQTAGSD